ncbi:hypothetical protein HPB49_002117 [Dermacentor silvarum]|uniref:Uncharacterized protein n=1 Tax=Dermacentor silvarum TaxID=543639 RepID=A0ACB8C0W6_DERSI|nr:hypothetical protein HPB49_002117 [Dermacentor silvarum]
MAIPEITKILKLQRVQVHRVVKWFKEPEDVKDRQRSRRPRTARTRELKLAASKEIKTNPLRIMRILAQEHGVSNSTMQLLVKENLKLKVRKPAKGLQAGKVPQDEAAEPR